MNPNTLFNFRRIQGSMEKRLESQRLTDLEVQMFVRLQIHQKNFPNKESVYENLKGIILFELKDENYVESFLWDDVIVIEKDRYCLWEDFSDVAAWVKWEDFNPPVEFKVVLPGKWELQRVEPINCGSGYYKIVVIDKQMHNYSIPWSLADAFVNRFTAS